MPFKKLFQSADTPKDGLSQPAREAIVDLLHFCMYADKHIAVSEDEFIEAAAQTLDWSPLISYESYEAKSTGAVTRALSDPAARVVLLQSIKARLPGEKERDMALRLAADLMEVDGTQTTAESKALAEVQALLK
ncbi:MAG: hypothetical protein V4773_05695 [Verrucomicrobiota bacterium]